MNLLCPPENHLQCDKFYVHHANLLIFREISCSNIQCADASIQVYTQNCMLCLKQLKQLLSPLYLNKPLSTLPKDALCQNWSKLALWFWRRFSNFVNLFLLFCYYLRLKKGGVLYLKELESPLPKDGLYQVWFKLVE